MRIRPCTVASRWTNCLAIALTPIDWSQTLPNLPTDSQTLQSSGPRSERQSLSSKAAASHSCAWITALTSAQMGFKKKRQNGRCEGGRRCWWWWGTQTRCFTAKCYHDNQTSTIEQMDLKCCHVVTFQHACWDYRSSPEGGYRWETG